ncbi:MAG: hypothetical protein DCC58_12835 [Chloroflexi bacterium]|nr:MAG: hypothetical protein DCC58_12835 [Chloroflexota bacterium]
MEHRKVQGEELERLLHSKKAAGFNYEKYLAVLTDYKDGDVVAVNVGAEAANRGEKIRFSRAARLVNKSLTWLSNPSENEIAFQLGPLREKRSRGQKRS